MRQFVKLASAFNVAPVLLQVFANQDLFGGNRIRADYSADSPHSATDDILLRFSSGDDLGNQLLCEWQPAAAKVPAARDVAFALMSSFRGEQLGRVMITRLPAGMSIAPHADIMGKYAHFYTRFHVPLVSEPGVLFHCAEDTVRMVPGEVWWFNGHAVHSVVNNSAADRLNLIIDLRTSAAP